MVTYQKKKKTRRREKQRISLADSSKLPISMDFTFASRVTLSCVLEFSIQIPKHGMSINQIRVVESFLVRYVNTFGQLNHFGISLPGMSTPYTQHGSQSLNHKNHEVQNFTCKRDGKIYIYIYICKYIKSFLGVRGREIPGH